MLNLLFWVAVLIPAAFMLYMFGFMVWVETQTRGDGYFARPLAERARFVALLQKHAALIRPVFEMLAKVKRLRKLPSIRYEGVTGPAMMCSKKSYAATKNYPPRPEDIFIATQMKCGTTWMQQIVFEVLCRGEGDLSDRGAPRPRSAVRWP